MLGKLFTGSFSPLLFISSHHKAFSFHFQWIMFYCWPQTCLIYNKISASQQALACGQNSQRTRVPHSLWFTVTRSLKTSSRWHQILMPDDSSLINRLLSQPLQRPLSVSHPSCLYKQVYFQMCDPAEVMCLYVQWLPLYYYSPWRQFAGQILQSWSLKAFAFSSEACLLQRGPSTLILQPEIRKDLMYVLANWSLANKHL